MLRKVDLYLVIDVSGPIGCHETSVNTYKSILRNTPEDRRSRLHRGGSLKSCKQRVNVFKNCVIYLLFPLRMFLSAHLYRWRKKTGHRLSRVQIQVLQGHVASVLVAKKKKVLFGLNYPDSRILPLNSGTFLPNYRM